MSPIQLFAIIFSACFLADIATFITINMFLSLKNEDEDAND